MRSYCNKCGNPLDEGSLFCETCGARISVPDIPVQSDEPLKPLKKPLREETYLPPVEKPAYVARRGRKFPIAPIALGIIFIIAIASLGTAGVFWLSGGPSVHLGDKSFIFESKDALGLNLNIENSEGDVSVEFVDSSTLFNATIKIYGKEDADISEAETFTSAVSDQNVDLSFDSPGVGAFFWGLFNPDRLTYSLDISIAKEARTNVVIDVSSGSINFDVRKPSTFTGMNLVTSSGNVDVDFGQNNTLDCPTIVFLSSSGSVNVDFGDQNTITSSSMNFRSSSGSVSLDLGTNTSLDCPSIDVHTSSGSLNLQWDNLIIEQDVDWDVDTSSGTIDFTINQKILPATKKKMTFDVDASSGSVSILYSLNSAIGLKLQGSVSSGSVNIQGGNPFQSTNYSNALLQLDFDIDVSSGNIVASSSGGG